MITGLAHTGVCVPDVDAALEAKGVQFIVADVADVARVRTTWFVDPWG